jgi:hypothetical protein
MAIPLAIRSLSQRRPGCDQSDGIAAVLLSNAGQVEPRLASPTCRPVAPALACRLAWPA